MTVTLYGYIPAWGLPCISPYVTKAANYMAMTGTDYTFVPQSLATLDQDSPTGKLPYIVDEDGTKVWDSTRIVEHLRSKHGHAIDEGMSAADRATALAFQRMVEENLYWSGIIEPRWRLDEGWHTYVPYILGQGDRSYDEVWPELPGELQEALDAFRVRILKGFDGQGMGRRSHEEVLQFFKDDVDALSDFLGDKAFFMGDQPRSVDAAVYAQVRHILDQPHPWPGADYLPGKANLVGYCDRMRERFGV